MIGVNNIKRYQSTSILNKFSHFYHYYFEILPEKVGYIFECINLGFVPRGEIYAALGRSEGTDLFTQHLVSSSVAAERDAATGRYTTRVSRTYELYLLTLDRVA